MSRWDSMADDHDGHDDLKHLLKCGADASIPEKDGYTPMHGAGFQGRAGIAKMLIDHGLDPSPRHQDGYTPIHRACWGREYRHAATVKAFLHAGVSPDEKTAEGRLPEEITENPETRAFLQQWKAEHGSSSGAKKEPPKMKPPKDEA